MSGACSYVAKEGHLLSPGNRGPFVDRQKLQLVLTADYSG